MLNLNASLEAIQKSKTYCAQLQLGIAEETKIPEKGSKIEEGLCKADPVYVIASNCDPNLVHIGGSGFNENIAWGLVEPLQQPAIKLTQ